MTNDTRLVPHGEMNPSVRVLDMRGMRCPWPALRVARALREMQEASDFLVVADDPAAPREIAAVAAERGWHTDSADSPIGPAIRLARLDQSPANS